MTLGRFPRRYRQTLAAVCRRHAVSAITLLSGNRTAGVVNARRVAAKLFRWQGMSFPEIGILLNRDHSSVVTLVQGGKKRRLAS